MGNALVHRGPDGGGLFVDAGPPAVGLVHRRLSIIDPENGRQPLSNEDDAIQVVFNGEIFNYVELRRDLVARGHTLRTRTDTEVLVHLYEDLGDDFVHELNGQFAFALWDGYRRRLLLVRDRPGILPLYVHERAGELLFGSEIKAILAALDEPPPVNADALRDVLTFWAPLAPDTLFKDVLEVEPGHLLVVENGRRTTRRYWSWQPAPVETCARPDPEACVEELTDLLTDATRIRLRADVDVGAFLSGGLDSSVLVALIARANGVKLRTFSVGFPDPALDERRFQRLMTEAAGTTHSEVCCGDREIGVRLVDVVRAAETPITRTGPVPMHLLASHVRESGCKVVLTGEGADEVFGGYDLFREAKVRAFCARQPGSRWRPRLFQKLYPSFHFTAEQSPALLSTCFGAGRGNPADPLFSHGPRWAAGSAVEQFLAPDLRRTFTSACAEERVRDRIGPSLQGLDLVQRAQVLEARTLMAGYLLCSQSDRMLMAHSVEGRFPYLDHRVIEFANRLDSRLHVRALTEKALLKRAARDLVPRDIIDRPKQPYRGPDAAALVGRDRPSCVSDLLDPHVLKAFGYFDPAPVTRLVRKLERASHERLPVTHRDSLSFVAILSMQVWHAWFQHGAASV
jgi:asparagine synthase (glutamine-hydrolysing)